MGRIRVLKAEITICCVPPTVGLQAFPCQAIFADILQQCLKPCEFPEGVVRFLYKYY